MIHKNVFLIAGFLISLSCSALAQDIQIASPDGKTVVVVTVTDGQPGYSVLHNTTGFLQTSPLGLKTNLGDFTRNMTMEHIGELVAIDETYQLSTIKKSKVQYRANEQILRFSQDGKPAFTVQFRVSNNDIAFRYQLLPWSNQLACRVLSESTGFRLPEGATTFLSPQSKAMVGFARTMPSYEMAYTLDDAMGKNGSENKGYTFPALFRVGNSGWILLSETGVDSRYCASRLTGQQAGLYTIGYPMPDENNGNGTAEPGLALPGYTPWRTITLGTTLKPIVETTIAFDVVKPLYDASRDYSGTKGSWSWIMKMDGGTRYDVQKEYIDFSAAMGYETVLVDALWDTQIGKEKMEELARYGAGKGVHLYLWYNSNGYWNDAPQGPRGIMDNTIARRREMAWMQRIGVKGIKVDFFGGDKQETIKLYEDILADANDYGIAVIFHGCTLPRGWERMYPNFVSAEAVLASENLHFNQYHCDREARNATIHPFVRNTVGSMDFGGSALNKFYNANNTPGRGSKRMTSEVFALATSVLFQSSVQHFALAPNNLTDAPSWAIDFMKKVPTTWDEVQFIDGYPGKFVILARRHGNKWYIAGINAQQETLKTTISLPMLPSGTSLTIYQDDANLNGAVKTTRVSKKQELKIEIPGNGSGIVVVND